MPAADRPRIVRFDRFEVDLRAGELRKNGVKIKLQERPFQVLAALLDNAGEVVTREELQHELWPTDTYVDFETGLNTAVKKLRDALGDAAEKPVFVETLAKRGYRFKAPIEQRIVTPAALPGSPPVRPIPSVRRSPLLLILLAATLVVVVLAWNWARSRSRIAWAGKQIESLAVLPLQNLSGDPEQEYFSEGMTEALITQLTKTGALRVTSRTSTMRYKGANKSLPEIARELNVDGVIEGSVMRSGQRVRITLQLIEGQTDRNVWTDTYERDLGDVLKMQSEIAQAVAQQIRIQLTPTQQARLRSASAIDPRAYEAYLKGRHYEPFGTEANIKQAKSYFEEAIRRDPGFALAYAGLADCYEDLGSYRLMPPRDTYQRASEAVNKALQLDETLGEAHSTLGYLDWRFGWDWRTGERELRYAVELDPNSLEAHETLAWYLAWSGRRDEALAEVTTIRRLDPVYPVINPDEAGVYYHVRDYKSLVEAGQKSIRTDPNNWTGHYFLAVGYEGLGQLAQAVSEYQQAIEFSQHDLDPVAGLAHLYSRMGRVADAEKMLDQLQQQSKTAYISPYMIATIYSGLGRRDRAFEFMEKAYQERSADLVYFIKADLRIDPLRSDPRFQDLWRRIGLPQ